MRIVFNILNVSHRTGSDADLEHTGDVMSVAGLMKLFLVGLKYITS